MVNWESQSKTPPQTPEDGHIYCIPLIRIAFCHVSKTCQFTAHFMSFWTSISVFYINTARDVVTLCLYSLNIYHFTSIFSHAHTEAHTHKHTCIISTQEEWRQPDTGACLRGAEEWVLLETKALHTHKKGGKENVRKKQIFKNLKKRIRAHRASSKATKLFLTK